jgi:ribosomal protein L37AE/L43A
MCLILKPLEIPEKVPFDLAIKRRIPSYHEMQRKIDEDYHLRMTGYRGEKAISYYLDKLPPDKFDIIHGLRLPSPNHKNTFFQLDKLLLSTSSLPLNIEVKNWKCDIHFDKCLEQVIKIYPEKNKRERAQNPVLQACEQSHQLEMWLASQGFDQCQIEYLFANSNDKSIITIAPGNEHILPKICTSETLIRKIGQIGQLANPFTTSSLKKLEDTLLAAHTPPVYDPQKEYQISQKEILPGVHCPKCNLLAMRYESGIWICPHCDYKSKTAYIASINDYFLLIKPTITNAELRWFLNISSPDVANYLLKSLHLPSSGKNKGRVYHKPKKNFPFDA